ncbi:putative ribonuclease H-like domain-containing protein, partial [Tanacetum coccineum]
SLSARIDSSNDNASLGDQEDASKQGIKIHDIDVDEDITLENVHDEDMFDTSVFNDEEVFVGQDMAMKEVSTADLVTTAGEVVTTANVKVSTVTPTAATITTVEPTLAQTLAELKSTRPKTKGVVMQEPSETTTTTTTTTIPLKDKGKGIMVEEPLKMKKKDQDKVETDYELAQRLQAEEQEELKIKEKSKLFQQLLEKRRKYFAAKRAEERRNRPPTKAQKMKLVGGSEVREDGSKTREESSSKRAGDELEQEPSKKQKVDDDKKLKNLSNMLKNFNREDLEVLWSIVKARFKKTKLVNYMYIFLHLNLKTMFEHHLEDSVWKNQQGTWESDSVHMVVASKVHMLKPGEYELWRMRMEQYIQMVDYSLWEVIENGNAPPITKLVEGVETIIAPSTAEEKAQRRLLRRDLEDRKCCYQNDSENSSKAAKLSMEIHGDERRDGLEVADGYAIMRAWRFLEEEHWKKAYCECLEEFVNEPIVSKPTVKKPVVETSEAKASADKPKAVRKNNGAPIIEDWVSDSEEEYVPQAKKEKKIVKSSFAKNMSLFKSKEQVDAQGTMNGTLVILMILKKLWRICCLWVTQREVIITRQKRTPNIGFMAIDALTKSFIICQLLQEGNHSKSSPDAGFKPSRDNENKVTKKPGKEGGDSSNDQEKEDDNVNNTNNINNAYIELLDDPNMPELEDIMDVKSAFLYGKIEEEVYVCQPPGFEDPDFPNRVYKVEKALYGLHKAPKAWRMEFLSVQEDSIVIEILKKISFTDVKTASTPMETQKPLLKDEDGEEVDVHLYRSMIGSLMYLTSSRPDIMFAVCAYARYQVNPKVSHLHAVKRIFRYLKRASLDRKSTTGGCQFLGCKLISWQCKKQIVVVNSTTESEYVAASSCCGQHIEIRHHFIRDSNEKKLIQMIKIHTDKNVADLLTKAFDVKTVNGEQQLQALVDRKKIIITKATVRRDLQLEDADGVDCLPNAIIFEQLTLIGGKGENVLFLVESPPLLSTMIVHKAQQEQGEGSNRPTDPHHTPTIIPPSTSQPQRKQRPRKLKRKDTDVTPRQGGNTRRNIMDIITTQWCQQ